MREYQRPYVWTEQQSLELFDSLFMAMVSFSPCSETITHIMNILIDNTPKIVKPGLGLDIVGSAFSGKMNITLGSFMMVEYRKNSGNHHAYCLFYSHGTCGKCIRRCPVNAISRSGHDKNKCMHYTEGKMNAYVIEKYGIDTYVCGLRQAGVPCMDHIPAPEEG